MQLPDQPDAQFRADRSVPLAAVGMTVPPWPGDDEAYEVPGAWPADPGGA
jgi:mannose-6-phosphate isomerase-like protein (cupin superfamily)